MNVVAAHQLAQAQRA